MTRPERTAEACLGLVALALLVLMPLVASEAVYADFGIYFAYAILAVSLAFLWGHVGLLNLGHAIYFGIGAYAMSVVTLGMLPGLPGLRSTWLGLLAAPFAAGSLALLIGWFFFSSRGLRGAFLGIVTLALAVIAERLAVNSTWLGGLNGLMNVPPLTLGLNGNGIEVYDPQSLYYVTLAVLAASVGGLGLVVRSAYGTALAAIRDNELRALTLGHDVRLKKMLALGLSGAVAGLAGALFVVQFGFASPSLIGFGLSADELIWVAGRGSLVAAALGAILVRFCESRFSGALGDLWPLVLGLVFMASVLVFPKGIFGQAIAMLKRLCEGGEQSN
jgi:ABC-type branched-subunit amino acid transport system permease subunit